MLRFVVRLIRNILAIPFVPLWWTSRRIGRPRGRWVVVRLSSRIVEAHRPVPWLQRWLRGSLRRTTSLAAIRRVVDHAIDDPQVEGLAFVLPRIAAGWAVCTGLREQLNRVTEARKQTVAHLSQGGGHREVFIASAAERVFMSPRSTITLLGLSAQARYVKPLLDKIGVEIEPFARKEYKTAAERFSRGSMSEAQREQVQVILDRQTDVVLSALAERIGASPQQSRALFERGAFRGEDAVEARLVDRLAYEDELPDLLACTKKQPLIEATRYLSYQEARFFLPLSRPSYIAVIGIQGTISESGTPSARRASIVAALRRVRQDRRALGALLWIDSPGGSADASDLIHREVVRLKEKKPLVAYFGEVAASGGYYVATHADAIIAQPLTLTGSIGVVSARLLADQLLDRIGVQTEVIRTAPHADMYSPHRPLTGPERALIDRELDAFYDSFVELVAEGRGRHPEEIERLARGRVWLGVDAHRHGLVDQLGGFDVALAALRDRLDLPARQLQKLEPRMVISYRWEPPPPAQSWLDGSVLAGWRDVALLLTEGQGVLYHVIWLPRIH